MSLENNPLILPFGTPYNTPPFHLIKEEHYLPAFIEAIKIGKEEIDTVVKNTDTPTFDNTLNALENCGELVTTISEIFFNLNSAETNDEIQKIAQEVSPLLTEYGNDIMLNEALFNRIKHVWENTDKPTLSGEENRLLEKSYKSFTRNGALLNADQKEELREKREAERH